MDKVVGIQILRALAALLVVLHHAELSIPESRGWFSFGVAGVDIFFVISGFVMAYVTKNSDSNTCFTDRINYSFRFILNRVVRIVPLYWLALVLTNRRDIFRLNFSRDFVFDVFFIPHWNSVYPDGIAPTLMQGWTLNYEMFFYFLFFCFLWVRKSYILTFVALLGFVFFGFFIKLFFGEEWRFPLFLGFYGNNILLEFCFGMVLQKLLFFNFLQGVPRKIHVVVALIAFLSFLFASNVGPRGIAFGVPAMFLVWSAINLFQNYRLGFLEIIADSSYAIYLFHWASFGALKPILFIISDGVSSTANLVFLILIFSIWGVIFGVLVHKYIERPVLMSIRSFLAQNSWLRIA